MIKVGTKVVCDPLKNLRLYSSAIFGNAGNDKKKQGVITYINKSHRWFLVECAIKNGAKIRRAYKFDCIGTDVNILDKGENKNGEAI